MKRLCTVVLLGLLLSVTSFSQEYEWVQKQSGSSLGGPIDYIMNNPDIVYYGSNNKIYKSTDRGETFSQTGVNVPNSSDIKAVILDDANPGTFLIAIESSPNDKIYKTTNDGATWTLTLNEGQMSFFGIPMSQDPSFPNMIYTMVNTNFKESTDFGDTWTTIASNFGPSSAPCDIELFPNSDVILIGDNGTGIFKSTDKGLTWSQKYFTGGEIPTISVDFTNPGVAWATKWGGGGGFLKSTDYGETWTAQSGFNGINMWGVHVQPDDGNVILTHCYSCGQGSWRTKNGGVTWTQISIPSSGYQVVSVDTMTQFAAQGNGFYKLESDYFIPVELTSFTASVGLTEINLLWTTATELNNQGFEIQRSFDNQNFEKIGFVPGFGTTTETKSYNYLVEDAPGGIHYYRLKQIDFDGTFEYSNSVEVDGPVPSDFVLHQNHPNPFNPSTSIVFSVPVESNVQIRLFNMLGQQVDELVNQDFQAGSHEVQFIASGLASGAYIYVIEAQGVNGKHFVSNKKMILMK